MRIKIIWKFFAAFIFLCLITVISLSCFLVLHLRSDVETKISQRLESNAILAGETFKEDFHKGDISDIQNRAKTLGGELHLRITAIDKQGKVLADTERDPASMENHSDRKEFIEAMEKGIGESTRLSGTLKFPMKYVAVRVIDGNDIIGVIRIAAPLAEVSLELRPLYRAVTLGAILAICVAAVIAYLMASNISRPIKRMKSIAEKITKGDFSEQTNIKGKDEVAELAESLNTMANELQVKIERLNRMDRVRSDFVANVSHELKTPLTSIRGFVETLEDGAINDKANAARFLAIIKKHTRRLGNIIDDLLRLSELESGGKIEMAPLDLKSLIDEVVMGFGHALSAKNQKLAVAAAGNFTIAGSRDKLEQVFVNLIDNAIKYTGRDGQIKVNLAETDNIVMVTVEDNGIGIPKEDIERVFERFYRVDKARSREVGGTGLGLSIAKHIVLAHRGEICIDSESGKGTRVIVTLPKMQQ
jgi:two-component system phosphate regulon sensor histidine kinase PhoR